MAKYTITVIDRRVGSDGTVHDEKIIKETIPQLNTLSLDDKIITTSSINANDKTLNSNSNFIQTAVKINCKLVDDFNDTYILGNNTEDGKNTEDPGLNDIIIVELSHTPEQDGLSCNVNCISDKWQPEIVKIMKWNFHGVENTQTVINNIIIIGSTNKIFSKPTNDVNDLGKMIDIFKQNTNSLINKTIL